MECISRGCYFSVTAPFKITFFQQKRPLHFDLFLPQNRDSLGTQRGHLPLDIALVSWKAKTKTSPCFLFQGARRGHWNWSHIHTFYPETLPQWGCLLTGKTLRWGICKFTIMPIFLFLSGNVFLLFQQGILLRFPPAIFCPVYFLSGYFLCIISSWTFP